MADPKPADLRELERASRALGETQKDLRGAFDKTTGAMGIFNARATTTLANVIVLEKQISALMKSTLALEEVLSGINSEFKETSKILKSNGDALEDYAKAIQGVGGALDEVTKKQEAHGDAQAKSGKAARLSSDGVKALGESLKATFTSLASGADPFKVFLEQGPAIAGVFAQAASGGVGLKGVLLGVAETVAPMLIPLAGVAAAAAALAAPFVIGAAEINKANGDIVGGLGLTEEELSRVTHKTVTMGDVFQATLNVIGRHFTDGPIGDSLKWLGAAFHEVFTSIVGSVVDRVGTIVGFWVAAYDTITTNWRNLPAALGVIFVGAVNMSIRHIEAMINGALKGLNAVIGMANKIPGVKLASFKPIDIPELQMVGGAAAQSIYAGFEKKQAEVKAGLKRAVSQGWKEVSDEAVDIVKKDALKQARSGALGGRTTNVTDRSTHSSYSADNYGDATNVTSGAGDAAGRFNTTVRTLGGAASLEDDLIAEKLPDPGKLASGAPELNERNLQLSAMIDHFAELNKLAPALGDSLEKAFGGPGKALTGVISAAATLGDRLATISLNQANSTKTDENAVKFARERVNASVSGFAQMSIAAQGFFDKNSSGYAALHSVEKAYRAWQMAQQAQAMAQEAAATVKSISSSMAKGAASTAAGAAKMFEVLGPFAFPAVAAMVALLAGFGLSGGAGGGSVPGANDMKTRQDAQGSGSVLGDSKAKSESLEKALTHAQAYENKDLEYGNAMVRSLKSIDDQIGAVAAALARSFGAGGMLSTEGLNLGKSGTSATLSNLGFSKSTTRTLQDQGIAFDAASLADIVAGGLSGSTYQQVLETTKKKAFGITTSNKSKVTTQTGALDADFLLQVTKLIGALGDGVKDAAKALQATGIEETLASFTVDLGKLSFKDMTGTQIEEALNAVFGKLGDDMAKAAVPAIAQFQEVGEGAFETLVRVARQYEVIDTTLRSVGMTFGAVGVASLEARERLVDLVGGLDALTDQASFFAEHFLTEEERLKPVKDAVAGKLAELKLPADLDREGFKSLVLSQNLSTEDGAKMYAALMALAPAFDKVATAAEAAKAAVEDKATSLQDQIDDLVLSPAQKLAKSRALEMEAVKKLDASLVPLLKTLWQAQDVAEAAKLATDRSNMYADLLEAQGRTEEAKALKRSLALAAIEDPVQKQYQQQIWAAEDAAAKVAEARNVLTEAYNRERDAIQATKAKFAELSKSLRGFSASLSATIAGSDLAGRYRSTRQAFLATAAMARLGDPDAMGRLQADGEAFTAASRDYVATSQDYLRDVGLVRSAVDEAADTADRQASIAEQQLDALNKSVEGLIQINTSVISVRDAIAGLQGALAQQAAVAAMPMPTPVVPKPATSSSWANPGKTLDGKYYYDAFLGNLAATTASHDPQYYPGGVNPALTPGTYEYSILETFKDRDPNGYYEMRTSLGFATGGSFEVGGSGPPDSKLFSLALSPGEAVNVRRRGDSGDQNVVNELRRLREELVDLRATSARIATSNDKMERTLTNVTEGGRAMQTQAAA